MEAHGAPETMGPSQDPDYVEAWANCAEFEPEPGRPNVMHPTSVLIGIAEVATSPCFHMGGLNPEYQFYYSWDTDIEDEFMPNGNPVETEFGLVLEFRGESGEIVQSWFTQSSASSTSSQLRHMFRNADAEFRKDLPLEELLWAFEKTPDECEIEPEEEEVEPEEKIKVELSDFQTYDGEESREFNRILVEANHGRVHGGTPLKRNPYMHVFMLGDGEITFTYEAPDSTEHKEDTILVYSSCEILSPKEQPLAETWPHELIGDKTIRIKRPTGWNGTISGRRADSGTSSGSAGTLSSEDSWTVSESIDIETSLQYDHAHYARSSDIFTGSSSGSFALSYLHVSKLFGDGQHFATTTRRIECSGSLDADLLSVSLEWDRKEGTYKVAAGIFLPDCEGTEVIEYVGGQSITKTIGRSQFFVGDGGNFYWPGTTDGQTISGSGKGAHKDWSYSLTYGGE
jgi:hypothetical protein